MDIEINFQLSSPSYSHGIGHPSTPISKAAFEVDGNQYRDPPLASMQRIKDCRFLISNGASIGTATPGLWNHCAGVDGKILKAWAVEECSEIVSSGHDGVVTLTNSHWLGKRERERERERENDAGDREPFRMFLEMLLMPRCLPYNYVHYRQAPSRLGELKTVHMEWGRWQEKG